MILQCTSQWSGRINCNLSRMVTKPAKRHVRPATTQISLGIRPVWSESSLCAQRVANDPSFLQADSQNADQTGWMPRLIWVFAGRTRHFVGFCHDAAHLSCLPLAAGASTDSTHSPFMHHWKTKICIVSFLDIYIFSYSNTYTYPQMYSSFNCKKTISKSLITV